MDVGNTKNTERTFVFSSDIFWGYKTTINIEEVESEKSEKFLFEVVRICKTRLSNDLHHLNLLQLVDKLNNTSFHIHSHTYEDIISADPNTVIYVCDCDI